MLQALRKAAVALLFLILIVAFAITGGADWFQVTSTPVLAKVGSVSITPAQFEQAYQRELETYSAQIGHRITQREAKAMGLPQEVLSRLMQNAALEAEAAKIGVSISEEGLDELIRNDEEFQEGGRFSMKAYLQSARAMGIEGEDDKELNAKYTAYLHNTLRSASVRSQLASVFAPSGVVPDVMVNAFNTYANQTRVIAYFTIDQKIVGQIEAPDEDALRATYDTNKRLFVEPERRQVAVLAITQETLKDKLAVTDEEVRAAYEGRGAGVGGPDRRSIQLLPFQTKQAAEKAADEIAKGKPFLEIAKEAGFTKADVDVGFVTKAEFMEKRAINGKIADTAFSMPKGQTSGVIEGPVSSVIVHVVDNFDEMKDQIRAGLEKAKVTQEMSRLTRAVEEDRNAAIPLAESAKKLGLPFIETTLDARGQGLDGKPATIAGGVPALTVASAAFKSDEGVENEVLRLPGNGYAWFDVVKVIKERQKPFEEVKGEVEEVWRREQIKLRLADKARELVKRIESGETIEEVAKSVGAEVKMTKPVKRTDREDRLSQSLIGQAFGLAQGAAASGQNGDGTSRTIIKVVSVTEPGPMPEPQEAMVRSRLKTAVANDNFHEYLNGIRSRLGYSIDSKAVAQVLGGGASVEE